VWQIQFLDAQHRVAPRGCSVWINVLARPACKAAAEKALTNFRVDRADVFVRLHRVPRFRGGRHFGKRPVRS
jgi:hypothetical protein